MTHDELVRFAAGKLNVEVHVGAAYDGKKVWYEAPTAICAVNFHHHNGTPFDLTSPNLFLKGLGVCPYHVNITRDNETISRFVFMNAGEGKSFTMKYYDKVDEVPLRFWQCWAALEGGKVG